MIDAISISTLSYLERVKRRLYIPIVSGPGGIWKVLGLLALENVF
jgi:hypothetical protein